MSAIERLAITWDRLSPYAKFHVEELADIRGVGPLSHVDFTDETRAKRVLELIAIYRRTYW